MTGRIRRNAQQFAEELEPVIADMRAMGHISLRAMAAELNRRGMMTRRGAAWQVSNVRNLVARLQPEDLSAPTHPSAT